MLRAVRVSNKLKSWNENQMSHVWWWSRLQCDGRVLLRPQALESNRCSKGSGSSQKFPGSVRNMWAHVLWSGTLPEKPKEGVGAGLHQDSKTTKWMLTCYIHGSGVCVCDRALTFRGINGYIVSLSEKLPVTLTPSPTVVFIQLNSLLIWTGQAHARKCWAKQAHSKLFIGQVETVIYNQAMANLLP